MIKNVLFTLMFIFLIAGVSAEVENFGNFKQNTCISIPQTCSNCTVVTLNKIQLPNGQQTIINEAMTKTGNVYNYTYCGNSLIGKYLVTTCGDVDGFSTCVDYTYEVSPNGQEGSLGFFIVIVLVLAGLVLLGFSVGDGWFVVFGGMGLVAFGLYSVTNGIAGYRDDLVTWGTSITLIGVGSYLAINSALEMIKDD